MRPQPHARTASEGQRQEGELYRPIGRELLKLLAWPALVYGLGFVLFLSVYALQVAGVL